VSPKLDEYRAKRDFDATPEPSGEIPADTGHRFVIQQHSATRLHWDLRLEHDGVLASWALPRGVPAHPKENHLAVHTEDHPMQYLDFHGEIPEGSYGAGSMFVWDTGTYDEHEWEDRKVVVTLHGARARGKYALFATRGRDWMIHRMDPPENPDHQAPPRDWRPMRATEGALPKGKAWAFEPRWSGRRAFVINEPGLTEIRDADGDDISAAFPEVRRIGRSIGAAEVVLDGVLTIAAGEPALERRLAAKSDSTLRRLARDQPAVFVAFDLLWCNGDDICAEPWQQRRARLDAFGLDGPAWKTPPAHLGDGAALLDAAAQQGVSALVAKRVRSRYAPGAVSEDWREVRSNTATGKPARSAANGT
jgi:bifunctional non-homologous end joining protein LigD